MEERDITVQVPIPDDIIYRFPADGGNQMTGLTEQKSLPLFSRFDYDSENGVQTVLKDIPYPIKGAIDPRAMPAVNLAKRVLMSQVRYISRSILSTLALVRVRNINNWIKEYNEICDVILRPWYLADKYYTPICLQINKFITKFVSGLGVREEIAERFGLTIATLIQYDDAYRYILEDLASETSKEAIINNPRNEIIRLVGILSERVAPTNMYRDKMINRFSSIARLITLALYIPKFKVVFIEAIKELDWSKMILDEADKYHTLRWWNYNFGGKTIEERAIEMIKIHKGELPTYINLNG